jgi:hypothetical protein
VKRPALLRGLLIAMVAITLSGCPVPLPSGDSPGSRHNLTDAVPDFIAIGQTTRADVLLALGEPDAVSEHDTLFSYGRTTRNGGVAFVVGSAGGFGAISIERMTYRRLAIAFDDAGRVADARIEHVSCTEGGLAGGGPEARSSPCLNVAALDARSREDRVRQASGEESGEVFDSVSWYAGTRGFDRIRSFRQNTPETPERGTLVVGRTGIWLFAPDADSRSEPLLKLAYADIAELYVDTFGLSRRVVLKHSSGAWDSFAVEHGSSIDPKATKHAGELARSNWQGAASR